MAAGLGFKDFTTGEVLTAADVDGYLMQGIWVFASAAARDAAVTSPQEGNFAFTKDNNSLWYYDGAAWVASGATGDIEGVTAGTGISGGGTSGTVTITNSMATEIDAKGDLVAGTGADTFARLAVGANNTVLTADSSTATGLKWAAAGGASGLTLVSSTSVGSGVSSVTISNAFSSTYDNYLIKVSGIDGSTNGNLQMVLGTTTTGYYAGGMYTSFTGTTVTGFNINNGSSFPNMVGYDNANGNNGHIVVNSPYLSDYTVVSAFFIAPEATGYFATVGGHLRDTTSYTAVKFQAAGGTITGGTIKIYGFQNS